MPKLTPEQMVTVKTMAPFELADIFREWAMHQAHFDAGNCLDGNWANLLADLGPPGPQPAESFEDYGQRIAAGIITLLKEV